MQETEDAATLTATTPKPKRAQVSATEPHSRLKDLVRPHVGSFDFFLTEGKDLLCDSLESVELRHPETGEYLELAVTGLHFGMPTLSTSSERLTPRDCREAAMTYSVPTTATIALRRGALGTRTMSCSIGRVPVMVGCRKCWVGTAPHASLPSMLEDTNEVGGYFICNGNEKVIRMLIYPRPNHPIAITRASWAKKGPQYSKFGCSIRCMRPDSTTQTVTLHYLSSGNVTLRFIFRKQEFFVPAVLLLKAMGGYTDRAIYEKLTANDTTDAAIATAAEMVLRATAASTSIPPLRSQDDALTFIGSRFKVALQHSDRKSDRDLGFDFIKKFLFVHLPSLADKAELMIFMMRKLFALAHGIIDEENVDSPALQSILLPGHLYLSIFKDLLQDWIVAARSVILKDFSTGKKVDFGSEEYFHTKLSGVPPVGRRLESFLATGQYNSRTGIDLMQVAGFVIMADRLNAHRFQSHFQSVHRGAFYATMKTTAIRKLMPESYGFFCPVHTPDGAPCGLLNHLAIGCKPVTAPSPHDRDIEVEKFLAELGVVGVGSVMPPEYLPLLFNGRITGFVREIDASKVADALRLAKVTQTRKLPEALEICHIDGRYGTGFKALYLSSDMERMVRPVLHLGAQRVEWIGALEQMFLDIALPSEPDEVARATHREFTPNNALSLLANMTPLSDMNQSPRNMYQCQMGKHSMGTPCHNWAYRGDNKFLRLVYPQRPISRTRHQRPYLADDYPSGINAVLAVISYTGYDMEDAFILNKASVERGFGHGTMYKTYLIDTAKDRHASANREHLAGVPANRQHPDEECSLDVDGLPRPGEQLQEGTPLYGIISDISGDYHMKKMTVVGEAPWVETVRIMPSFGAGMRDSGDTMGSIRKANVKLRFQRNPVIGDKFSSRHGQKGVTSRLWAQQDMPFSESGITPDCIINPCAFPSRMTIGMLVESMAGKAGALHGLWQDTSSFHYDEKRTAVQYFGDQLTRAGYRYYGTEPMYSGVTGEPFEAEIYIGVVYYQRLVHQVKDKFQVRSFGPVNELTQQPVHGRKRGGGIRLGEMERDSLIAHGASMLVHDRLFNCSDRSLAFVCRACGSVVSALPRADSTATCKECGGQMDHIFVPFVMRYLACELAAMNIRLSLFTS